MKNFFREFKILTLFLVFFVGMIWAVDYFVAYDYTRDGTLEFSVDKDGNTAIKGTLAVTGAQTMTGAMAVNNNITVAGAYRITVATSTVSADRVCMAGAFVTLPTTGYSRGTLAYQTSDNKLYVATMTVVAAGSWLAL